MNYTRNRALTYSNLSVFKDEMEESPQMKATNSNPFYTSDNVEMLASPSPTRGRLRSLPTKMIPQPQKTLLVLSEIFFTEIQYYNDLKLIVEIFLNEIRKRKLIPEKNIHQIFWNIEGILDICSELQKQIKTCDDIVNVFLSNTNRFQEYFAYCANQKISLMTLQQSRKEFPNFHHFLANCFQKKQCRGLDLESFLIKPIQRVCKYPLLFETLLQAYTNSSDSQYVKVKELYEKMKEIVTRINEGKRQAENQAKLLEIQNSLNSNNFKKKNNALNLNSDELDLISPDRFLIKEGNLNIIKNNKKVKAYFYLFNDLLIHASITKKSTKLIESIYNGISWVESSQLTGFTGVFKIIADLGKGNGAAIILASAPSEEEKESWIKEIHNHIQNKNPSISSTKPLFSPRKVSSPIATPKNKEESRSRVPSLSFSSSSSFSSVSSPSLKPTSKKRIFSSFVSEEDVNEIFQDTPGEIENEDPNCVTPSTKVGRQTRSAFILSKVFPPSKKRKSQREKF